MKPSAEPVLKKAFVLPEVERADITGALLDSLEPAEEAGVEAAWRQEVAARVAALGAGEVQTIPWEEVRNRFLQALRIESPR